MPLFVQSVNEVLHLFEHYWFSVEAILMEIAGKVVNHVKPSVEHGIGNSLVKDGEEIFAPLWLLHNVESIADLYNFRLHFEAIASNLCT